MTVISWLFANSNVMSSGVALWWLSLCSIAVLNVALWAQAAEMLEQRMPAMSVGSLAVCRIQLMLAAVYVFGCAFRSLLPVYDIPRLCLFDTWLSSVVVGRSIATLAELSFASQWAILLYATATAAESMFARMVSFVLVPLIATAEVCSWYAVLTTSNLAHVAENSTWAIAVMLVIVAMLAILPRCAGPPRRVLFAWCMAGMGYVAFMLLFDIPAYWSRHVADEVLGRHYLTLVQGLADVTHRRVVSYRWEDWRSEIVWMTLYFSVGVWFSISLINARIPIMLPRRAARKVRAPAAA